MGRIEREKKTVMAMIRIYCHGHHGQHDGLCQQCRLVEEYALRRLDRCPFGETKSTCARCRVHCYRPVMREHIRRVMRYAGPRVLLHHPVLALRHLLDERMPPREPRR